MNNNNNSNFSNENKSYNWFEEDMEQENDYLPPPIHSQYKETTPNLSIQFETDEVQIEIKPEFYEDELEQHILEYIEQESMRIDKVLDSKGEIPELRDEYLSLMKDFEEIEKLKDYLDMMDKQMTSGNNQTSEDEDLLTIDKIIHKNGEMQKRREDDILETKKQKERERVANAKRKTVSFEGEQESLCLGLLMRHGLRFVLLKPRKLNIGDVNSLNAIFMTIQKIHIGEHMIDFNDLIQNDIDKVDEYLEENEMTKSNRNYHLKKNLICSTNNFLSELLLRIGYNIDFNTNNSTKNFIIQLKRIVSISGKGMNLIDKSSVSEMGIQVNKRFKTIFQLNVKKSETPYEFGYEHVNELFDRSDNQQLTCELYIYEYSKHVEKRKHKGITTPMYDFDPMKEDYVDFGYEIIQCEFGWYASPLKKEMKSFDDVPDYFDY